MIKVNVRTVFVFTFEIIFLSLSLSLCCCWFVFSQFNFMSCTFHISQQHHSLCRRRRRCHSSHRSIYTQWEMNAVCLHLRVLFIRGTCVLSFIQPLFSMELCAQWKESILYRKSSLCYSLSLLSAFGSHATTIITTISSPLHLAILRHSDRCMQFLILHFQLLLYSTNDNETTTYNMIYHIHKRCEHRKQLLVYEL